MKKQYIPLAFTLMASSAGFAQSNDAQPMRQTQEQHPSDCCRPCCVPQPRDPICCECYVPAWNDMQCDWGLYLTADYLYWYARECGLTYATKLLATEVLIGNSLGDSSNSLVPTDAVNMDTKWQSGVRVGLGWNTDCDGWDFFAQWTGYWNDNSSSSSVALFDGLVPEVDERALLPNYVAGLPESSAGIAVESFEKVKAKWDFKMNRFDLQIGKRYWLSKCFTMRPYAGLGGIWTETDFVVNPEARTFLRNLEEDATETIIKKADIENSNWGAGFIGGFQPTWQFAECFGLWADIGMALLWGELKEKNVQTSTRTTGAGEQTYRIDYKNHYFCMNPILDLALGVRWETYWCDQQFHFALDLGWEHHILFQHNHRTDFGVASERFRRSTGQLQTSGIFTNLLRETNVVMGGLVVRVRFDF